MTDTIAMVPPLPMPTGGVKWEKGNPEGRERLEGNEQDFKKTTLFVYLALIDVSAISCVLGHLSCSFS